MKLSATFASRRVPSREAAPVGWFEFAPSWLFYLPVVLQWIALGIRYGDFSLPTAANPGIENGGLAGESKSAILDLLAAPVRELVAPYGVFATAPDADPAADLRAAGLAMVRANLAFPVVAKPDVGCNGAGVRLIDGEAALLAYLTAFPRATGVVLQSFICDPNEAGIFYVREPGHSRGRITSVTLKHEPFVTGDGRRTIAALVGADPRYSRQAALFARTLGACASEIPAAGSRQRLVFVGNHCRGSVFEDGRAVASERLADRMEQIATALPGFHFGRIDIKFESLAELRRGRGFTIIEINGVGSEATHIWDPRARLLDAMRAQLWHFGAAWRIAAANRRAGARTTGLLAMAGAWLRQRKLMASYPQND